MVGKSLGHVFSTHVFSIFSSKFEKIIWGDMLVISIVLVDFEKCASISIF